MSRAAQLVITRPQRSPHFRAEAGGGGAQQFSPGFSPVASFQATFTKNPALEENTANPNALVPRPPVVHFFVCDHGNAKVKAFSDQFIELLTENGIRVFPELYLTHQPGYQVRAASFNTSADFFFQIHSKTAGPGRVRLYIDGQPKRMSIQEAVTYIWSAWRLKCGALSKAEADSLSSNRVANLLEQFADIKHEDVFIDPIQSELRNAIKNGLSVSQSLEKLNSMADVFNHGRQKLFETRIINSEWKREPGTILSRCLPMPIISGLSIQLKEILISMVEQTQKKISILQTIAQNHLGAEPRTQCEEDEAEELEIPVDQQSQSNWGLMIESVEDDHQQSLSSIGDHVGSQGFMAMAQNFLLDDY